MQLEVIYFFLIKKFNPNLDVFNKIIKKHKHTHVIISVEDIWLLLEIIIVIKKIKIKQ
jgi:hypothetical protein